MNKLKELEKKYIKKCNSYENYVSEQKMRRNLQAEIHQLRSITKKVNYLNESLISLGYISPDERERFKKELTNFYNAIDFLKNI